MRGVQLAVLGESDVRGAELLRLSCSPDLQAGLHELLAHPSPRVRQAAGLSPVLRNERAIGPVLIEALASGDGSLIDGGEHTFHRLVELGTSNAVLAALASSVLARKVEQRESWGAAVSMLARYEPRALCQFAERWLLEQVAVSTSTRPKPGLEYDGLAFDPDFRGPYLYAALAELPAIPEQLARLLAHISRGGFRRGYTAMFPLAARGDAHALQWLGRAYEWMPPGALSALGQPIVPYLVETLAKRHSGVAYAFAALEALDAAPAERASFVHDVMEELRLAPPGAELTRAIELLSAAVNALSGEKVWSLLASKEAQLDTGQLARMFELLARLEDPRLGPYLLERARRRDGVALLFLAEMGKREALEVLASFDAGPDAKDPAARASWAFAARKLQPRGDRVTGDAAAAAVRSLLSLARWAEDGPAELLHELRQLARDVEARALIASFTGDPDLRTALLARAALCDPPSEPKEEPRPFTMEWAKSFRRRSVIRRRVGAVFLDIGPRSAPVRA